MSGAPPHFLPVSLNCMALDFGMCVPKGAFQKEVANMTHLPGACHSKTSRNKRQQETEYIILALQAENKQQRKSKLKSSVYIFINVSMRAL